MKRILVILLYACAVNTVQAFDLSMESYDKQQLQTVNAAKNSTDPIALYAAANVLWYDSDFQENVEQGTLYMEQAANAGFLQAIEAMGEFYYEDSLADADNKKAIQWFEKSTVKNSAHGYYSLGTIYYEGGAGVDVDYKKAFDYFLKSAELGNDSAMYDLGFQYKLGEGVKQNNKKAFYWFKKSADLGDARSAYQVGYAYQFSKGVEQNCAEAIAIYQKTFDEDEYTRSAVALADIYYDNRVQCAVKRSDYKKSFSFYKSAAYNGNTYSKYQLGYAYRNGHGVYSDFVQSLAWYSLADEDGYQEAANAIREVKTNMSSEQIAKAGELKVELAEEVY